MQRSEAKLYAVAEYIDIFLTIEAYRAAQQRLVFITVGRDVMMAVEPPASRVGAQSMDGSSELPFSSVSSCGVFSRITATEQLAVP